MPQSTKKTAGKATPKAATPTLSIPAPVIDFQRRVLKTQRSLFERTFDAVVGVQERQEDAVNDRLKGSSSVPEPLKSLAASWTESQRSIRSTYRDAVLRNYALLDEWVGGFAKSA